MASLRGRRPSSANGSCDRASPPGNYLQRDCGRSIVTAENTAAEGYNLEMECLFCDFVAVGDVEQHLHDHMDYYPFKCLFPDCGCRCPDEESLDRHCENKYHTPMQFEKRERPNLENLISVLRLYLAEMQRPEPLLEVFEEYEKITQRLIRDENHSDPGTRKRKEFFVLIPSVLRQTRQVLYAPPPQVHSGLTATGRGLGSGGIEILTGDKSENCSEDRHSDELSIIPSTEASTSSGSPRISSGYLRSPPALCVPVKADSAAEISRKMAKLEEEAEQRGDDPLEFWGFHSRPYPQRTASGPSGQDSRDVEQQDHDTNESFASFFQRSRANSGGSTPPHEDARSGSLSGSCGVPPALKKVRVSPPDSTGESSTELVPSSADACQYDTLKSCATRYFYTQSRDSKSFSCAKCGQRVFRSVARVMSHALSHCTGQHYYCNVCGQGFKCPESAFEHVSRLHPSKRANPSWRDDEILDQSATESMNVLFEECFPSNPYFTMRTPHSGGK